jgi:hypothetical protein
MARNATGRNKGTVVRPIGTNTNPIKFDTEGTDANGREIVLARPEVPTRIDEVSKTLFYLGWAELATDESDLLWKIRRIQQVGSVWEQKYVNGNEFYRSSWTLRAGYVYL